MQVHAAVVRRTLAGLAFVFSAQVFAGDWVATQTPGIEVKQASLLGALDAATPLHLGLSLRLRNRAQLDQYLVSASTPGNPLYGRKMSTQEFMDGYAPTAEQAQRVVDYLAGAGFRNIELEASRTIVVADGSAVQARNAFNTTIQQYQQLGRIVYANDTPASVPSSLGDVVLSVMGGRAAPKVRLRLLRSARLPPRSGMCAGLPHQWSDNPSANERPEIRTAPAPRRQPAWRLPAY